MENFNFKHPRAGAGRFTTKNGSAPETGLPPAAPPFAEVHGSKRRNPFYPPDFHSWPQLHDYDDTSMDQMPFCAHYSVSDVNWYVSEVDPVSSQAFLFTDYGHGLGFGFSYLSMTDLEALSLSTEGGIKVVERDTRFVSGQRADQVLKKYRI